VCVTGVNLLQESNLIAGILLNGMFLMGTFTFAVVLGIVSDDISSEVKVIRQPHMLYNRKEYATGTVALHTGASVRENTAPQSTAHAFQICRALGCKQV